MKLATYQDGSRDGQLVVVSRDLASAHYATGIASRLQAVLDDWNFLAPQLQDLSDDLAAGRARHAFAFDPAHCMAPLPRTGAHLEGRAYPHHHALAAELAGTEAADAMFPGLLRLGGTELLGAQDDVLLPGDDLDADFEAGLAVVTGDIPMGCSAERAEDGVRLVLLACGIALRRPGMADTAFHCRPATAFGPVAVTPDELGTAWSGGRLSGTLQTTWNGRKVGLCETGDEMQTPFGALVARMARTGRLRAGSIVGSGPASNAGSAGAAAPSPEAAAGGKKARRADATARREWPRGYASIAEKRAMETLQDGAPKTGFLQPHDTLRLEMKGRDGVSVFGAIAHEVQRAA